MQEDNRKRKRPLNIRILIVYIISFIVLQLVAVFAIGIFPELLEDDQLFAIVLSVLNLLWYLGLTIALFSIARIYLFDNQWGYFKSDKARSLGFIAVGFFAILLVNGVIGLTMEQLGYEVNPENQAALESLLEGGPIAIISLILFAGFLAPIVEEIVFRKGLWDVFEKPLGFIGAIILNSFFFGFIHIIADISLDSMQLLNIVPYFGMGLVISLIYYYSGKIIFVPIFVHMAYNMFALIAMFVIS